MSAFDNKSARKCELEQYLNEEQLPEHDKFVDAVVLAQAEEACDELGDSMIGGVEFVQACLASAGVTIKMAKAGMIATKTETCLKQRYMGACKAVDECTGRIAMEQRLARLGLVQTVNQ